MNREINELTQEIINQFQSELESISKGIIQQFNKAWSPYFDEIERTRKSEEAHAKRLSTLLSKSVLWMTPTMPYAIWANLKALDTTKATTKSVEKVFINQFQKDNWKMLVNMTKEWDKNELFKVRSLIIQDALEAHILGKYTLSIPSLLPQVEGILSSITEKSAGKPKKLLTEVLSKEQSSFLSGVSEGLLLKLATSTFLYNEIEPMYFSTEQFAEWIRNQGISEENIMNRHAILHGIQINYSSKINSLRAFLLLDSLYSIQLVKSIIGK